MPIPELRGLRVGVDLVVVEAFARKLTTSPSLLGRCFTADERVDASHLTGARRDSFLAGRFAAKEAMLKALGTGLSGDVALTDIEVGAAASGAPWVALRGAARDVAGETARCAVSISHDGGFAIAVVVLDA